MQEVYSFNVGETGLAFLTLAIGATLGFATTIIQDRLYRKHGKLSSRHHHHPGPLNHLYAPHSRSKRS